MTDNWRRRKIGAVLHDSPTGYASQPPQSELLPRLLIKTPSCLIAMFSKLLRNASLRRHQLKTKTSHSGLSSTDCYVKRANDPRCESVKPKPVGGG